MSKRVVILEQMLNRAIRFRIRGEQSTFAEMLNGVNQYEGILKGVGARRMILDGVCQKCKPHHGNFVYLGDDCPFPTERIYDLADASNDYELSDVNEPDAKEDQLGLLSRELPQ